MAVHLQKPWPTALFMVAHLESQYTAHASAPLPSQLFLKTSRPDCIVDFPIRGQKEVAFYPRSVGLGTVDLAYMMALHWYPERHARLEQTLLRRYYTQLLTHGIVGYDWDACWDDYRLAAIRNRFMPMGQWAAKRGPAIWWPHLERTLLAFEDLQCRELL